MSQFGAERLNKLLKTSIMPSDKGACPPKLGERRWKDAVQGIRRRFKPLVRGNLVKIESGPAAVIGDEIRHRPLPAARRVGRRGK